MKLVGYYSRMLQVNNLSKSFGEQVLFNEATFNFPSKGKIGLVGRNGSGKSTLLKIILGEEHSDTGSISLPKNYKIGTLKQHIAFSRPTVLEECVQMLPEELKYETYRAEKILSGLGFSQEDFHADPMSFSGGYQVRINLAKVLVTNPDLLLLDEPTNYLDILSLRWLRNFLSSFDGEVLLITHDQGFMDSVVTHTLGIHRKGIRLIKGATEKYYSKLIEEEEQYEKDKANFDKRKQELERFVERFKAKASKATQAQSKLKQLQKMGTMDDLDSENDLDFNFNYSEFQAKTLLEVNSLSFGYEENNELFQNVSFALGKGDCIGIIGKNGKGKSTLLNCLSGDLSPSGEVKYHPKAKLGHFGQTNISRLNNSLSICDEIGSVDSDITNTKVRQIAGTMMFPGDLADKKVSVLSGGEKSRVMLGKIIAKPNNILFLDEPTNHLDMQSIESLCEAIEDFKGGSIIVTHSEMLLKRLVNKLIIFHQGKAEFFLGNYEDFLNKIGWEEDNLKDEKPKAKITINKKELQKQRAVIISERSKELKPLTKRITELEELIDKNEKALAEKNDLLVKASESSDSDAIVSLSSDVSKIESTIEEAFEELAEKQEVHDELNLGYEQRLDELKNE